MLKWLKNLLKEPQEESDPKLMIWGVLEGPLYSQDVPESDFPDDSVMLVMKVSRGKEVFDAEFWFDTYDEAYALVKHFDSSIKPIEINNSQVI